MPKISLIGSGYIGALVGQLCLVDNLGDVVLYDVVQGVPQGKGLDLKHLSTILGVNRIITGTNNIEDIKDSDVIVITAGVQRKEGMSREDLIGVNGKIMKSVAESVKTYSPNAFVICVSNPLDIMVNVFHKYSNLPHEKICGMAGILDTARFRTLLAEKLNVSPANINAIILGGHGDLMVPLERYCSVSGIPLSEFVKKNLITSKDINEVIEKTRDMGAEIIKLAKSSAAFAPAAAIVNMIKSFLYNQNKLFTCAVYLNGLYKCSDLFVGSTTFINNKGVYPIEFPLTQEEQQLYDKSIEHVKVNVKKAFDIIN
ncbi:malate dehydrogenase [Plasmodium brasilianum]|uniref:L-lactate dehydrogenase n=2 Tax=Plasmodium (Plasmodium) TaxID=418103 RepID=A0A1A8W351_PLAMA|nr:malate dehydrogenase, putative [Plasmodium malariae]KAI4837316.1 malate dehydrogenase [Plasmodium brasilianum]SBS87209.1 malate dehydrogenase, putative [Plasmodium malariae]SCO93198.1 malate dehydrogenase, putative [Plasmodium malariae]